MRVTVVYRGRYHVREALDLETLVPLLRGAGHQVTFVYHPDPFGVTDNVFQAPALARAVSPDREVERRVLESEPEAVLFSVLPSTFPWCVQTAETVRRHCGAPVVFFGLQPSLVPERAMREPAVDYVIQGEVENVVNPLLEAVASGGDVARVGNLWHRADGEPAFTGRADLVDLDMLPLPDKALFEPYVDHHFSYSAMVSRGCPYRCTFCEETCLKKLYPKGYFRRKRVETVMRELVAGRKRTRYREVIFKDSYLSGNKVWLRELMDRYRREIGVPFKCFCTITGFDEETARLLKEGGCYSIEFGLQTWNDRLRRDVLGRRETGRDALRVLGACDDVGLWYDVDHLFNLPTETRADHELGIDCYRRLRRLGRIKVHFLVYLPTADIVKHGVEAGDLPPDAPQRLADGVESDFYDQSTGDERRRRLVAGYAALYKLLPMLPEGLVRWLRRDDRVLWLGRVPKAAMAALQGLNALRSGDLRFLAYLQGYPVKLLRSLRRDNATCRAAAFPGRRDRA